MAHVLVIDDEPLTRGFLTHLLVAGGHTVREAGDGRAGVQAFEAERPDVVFCDLYMPEHEGITAIRTLRRLDRAVPIVAMSGGGRLGLIHALEDAVALGATLGLPKPVSPVVLRDVIAELLDGTVCSSCGTAPVRNRFRLCPSLDRCPMALASADCGSRRAVAGAITPASL